jgi:hypothetical protein
MNTSSQKRTGKQANIPWLSPHFHISWLVSVRIAEIIATSARSLCSDFVIDCNPAEYIPDLSSPDGCDVLTGICQ